MRIVTGCKTWLIPASTIVITMGGGNAHLVKEKIFCKGMWIPGPKRKKKRTIYLGLPPQKLNWEKENKTICWGPSVFLSLPNVCSQQLGKSDQQRWRKFISEKTGMFNWKPFWNSSPPVLCLMRLFSFANTFLSHGGRRGTGAFYSIRSCTKTFCILVSGLYVRKKMQKYK